MEYNISSVRNPKIRQLLNLQQKTADRRQTGLFVVEGKRELFHCIDSGYEVDTVFYCSEILLLDSETAALISRTRSYSVDREVYKRIAFRGTTEGIMAQMHSRSCSLADLRLSDCPLIVVMESVEKPGNLGAVLRTADAAGADAVIVCDPLTDLYNPNVIRSSVGAVFCVPCVCCTSAECISYLKAHGIQILTAQLQDSAPYYSADMRRPTAIVMGTESTGLTDHWREAADAHIRIPMLGKLDSLNVSTSAAILIFEAIRQRLL